MTPRPAPLIALLFSLAVAVAGQTTAQGGTALVWRASTDFREVTGRAWVPSYVETPGDDRTLHGRAIRTPLYQGLPAAVEVTYQGPAGDFLLRLIAVAEEDGESSYAIEVNGRRVGEAVNPRQREKRAPVAHDFPAVRLEPGATIRVIFRGHSNGLIPEGKSHAWSRGRWRALEVHLVKPTPPAAR